MTWSIFFFFALFSRNHFQSNRHRRTPTVGLASLIETDLGVSGDVRQIPPVWNCLTKGSVSLKILYNKKKNLFHKKKQLLVQMGKNLYKQRIIFLCRCTRHFYCFLILFLVTVIHKHCYRLLGIQSHTHTNPEIIVRINHFLILLIIYCFILLLQGWKTENRSDFVRNNN